MSAALRSALRARFQRYIEDWVDRTCGGVARRVIGCHGDTSGAADQDERARFARASGTPAGSGQASTAQGILEELLAQDPDIALFKLRDALADAEGVQVHHSSIADLLSRLGFTYKKRRPPLGECPHSTAGQRVASERRRTNVSQQRADWFAHRLPAIGRRPERVVFINETAVKTNLTRLRGRSLRGQRLTMDAPFGSWSRQTLIAGLTHETLIAPWVIKGAVPLIAINCRQ